MTEAFFEPLAGGRFAATPHTRGPWDPAFQHAGPPAALSLGGNVRVGLEDNFYLPDGEMARSNGELVARAARMATDAGRRLATVSEARAMLGL